MASPTRDAQDYEIRLKGQLDARWARWFDGMTMMVDANGNTLLRGKQMDQAALFGLLKKVRDIGMPLLSLQCIPPEKNDDPVHPERYEGDIT